MICEERLAWIDRFAGLLTQLIHLRSYGIVEQSSSGLHIAASVWTGEELGTDYVNSMDRTMTAYECSLIV